MSKYNIDAEEIAKVISLYSRIADPEKRIYAQGYLNSLSDTSSVTSSNHVGCVVQKKLNNSPSHQQTSPRSTYQQKG